MKSKMSITLDSALVRGIEEHSAEFGSRSEFIEAAVQNFISLLQRRAMERKDLEILDRNADSLNAEAEDVLEYQVKL